MKKQFSKNLLKAGLCLLLSGLVACQENTVKQTSDHSSTKDSVGTETDVVKRGEYLVTTMGCGDCHSPKKINEQGIPSQDPELLLSGHPQNMVLADYDRQTARNWALFNMHQTAAVGLWGISFAANITSDPTGIGNWTEEQFFKAMKEGKYKGMNGTRPLMPPMPWQNFAVMTNDDLHAIFVFLKSTKPVSNVVPAYQPPVNQ